MRLAMNLLIVACLCVGALSASTAYLVRIDGGAEHLHELAAKNLTLSQPAGIAPLRLVGLPSSRTAPLFLVLPADDSRPNAMLPKGTPLTLAAIQQLRGETVEGRLGSLRPVDTVSVKEFSFARWRGKWLFLLSLAGMVGGALLLRRASRQTAPSVGRRGDALQEKAPLALLEESLQELRDTRAAVSRADTEQQRLKLIVERLGRLQLTHLAPFIDGRDRLTRELGLRRMAEILDGFSAAERQVNRAWSAASDNHEPEALACLNRAAELIQAPLARLRG